MGRCGTGTPDVQQAVLVVQTAQSTTELRLAHAVRLSGVARHTELPHDVGHVIAMNHMRLVLAQLVEDLLLECGVACHLSPPDCQCA